MRPQSHTKLKSCTLYISPFREVEGRNQFLALISERPLDVLHNGDASAGDRFKPDREG